MKVVMLDLCHRRSVKVVVLNLCHRCGVKVVMLDLCHRRSVKQCESCVESVPQARGESCDVGPVPQA